MGQGVFGPLDISPPDHMYQIDIRAEQSALIHEQEENNAAVTGLTTPASRLFYDLAAFPGHNVPYPLADYHRMACCGNLGGLCAQPVPQ